MRVLLACLVLTACAQRAASPYATVDHAVDGDTVDVVVGGRHERVRLIGVDTPEMFVERGPPDCYGPEASAFTRRVLAPGTPVRLVRDVVGRDDYGRLLAYVFLLDGERNGAMVNELLVAEGFAVPLTIEPNATYAARFVAAATAAADAGLGLWGACGG